MGVKEQKTKTYKMIYNNPENVSEDIDYMFSIGWYVVSMIDTVVCGDAHWVIVVYGRGLDSVDIKTPIKIN